MTYCHIAEIAVSSEYRNQGIGGRLLQAAEDWGRRVCLVGISRRKHTSSSFYQRRMGYRLASLTAI